MPNARSVIALLALALPVLLAAPARAEDWTREVRPGLVSFKRITGGDRPQKIYAVGADLSVPNIGLHASADDVNDQWRCNTLHFAEEVGAIAAINGDWSCVTSGCTGDRWLRPLGLAIEGGMMWNPHRSPADPEERWGFLACTVDKRCTVRTMVKPLNNPDMVFDPLHNPTIAPLRYHNAIGGNGLRLIANGERGNGCYDSQSAPRSAACLQADGLHLWLVVIDGRNPDGGETGMTCAEVRDLLLGAPFSCYNAIMLDGGGSSTLVVEDTNTSPNVCWTRGDNNLCVKNSPSDGSLRTVGNHLGITWSDAIDSRCRHASGKWCEGTRIAQCEGGIFHGSGDCAAYGATCQEDGLFAFCVDWRCPGGNGLNGTACLDPTRIASCTDGQYGEGDCGVFGLVCGGAPGAARCMDSRCPAPDAAVCVGDTWTVCSAGGYTGGVDCAAQGLVCDNELAGCMDGRCLGPNTAGCVGDTWTSCSAGVYSGVDCAAQGLVCDNELAGCMDGRCLGPDAAGCVGDTWTSCSGGAYSGFDCASVGLVCDNAAAGCLDPHCLGADFAACQGDVWTVCSAGVYTPVDCAAQGLVCSDLAGGCIDGRCLAGDSAGCVGTVWAVCSAGQYSAVDCAAQGLVCDPGAAGCVPPTIPPDAAGADAGSGTDVADPDPPDGTTSGDTATSDGAPGNDVAPGPDAAGPDAGSPDGPMPDGGPWPEVGPAKDAVDAAPGVPDAASGSELGQRDVPGGAAEVGSLAELPPVPAPRGSGCAAASGAGAGAAWLGLAALWLAVRRPTRRRGR